MLLERSTSNTSYSTSFDAVYENFYTASEDEKDAPDAKDVFFRYVSCFDLSEAGYAVSLYRYYRLSVQANSPNVLLNEVVFVGIDDAAEDEAYYIVPARVAEVTLGPVGGAEEARQRACALLDGSLNYPDGEVNSSSRNLARKVSASAFGGQSSFMRFTQEETATLMTIAEMRRGNEYTGDAAGNAVGTYYADRIYGAFGTDILALGTLMFGMSPFGLRFFPMLAAFGALVVLSRLAARLMKSERAGFLFALTFGLSGLALSYGHLGTPLMLGIFFFACALDLVHRFYANGIKKADLAHVLPLLAAGLFGAAAMCVNGAFAVPLAGVVALFICGMVRQQKAKAYALGKALEEPAEPAAEAAEPTDGEPSAPETPEQRARGVIAGYRFRNSAAPVLFFMGLIFGTFLFALLGMLPAYFVYLKVFDDPSAPQGNAFLFAWRLFAGGFTGTDPYMGANAWNVFRILFRGEGAMYAVTAAVVNPAALLVGAIGVCFAIYRLIALAVSKTHDKPWRVGIRKYAILLGGLLLSLIAALAVKAAAPFVVLFYLFCFLCGTAAFGETSEHAAKACKAAEIVYIVLLSVCFALTAVFAFSIPLPGTFLTSLIG